VKHLKGFVAVVILTLFSSLAFAQAAPGAPAPPPGSTPSATCTSARAFERILSDLCWDCIFPIAVAGVPIGPGTMPRGANSNPLCMCDPPFPGITMGAWFPIRIVEAVKTPGCSPTFGGVNLPFGADTEIGGYSGTTEKKGLSDRDFRHNHYFSFPVGELLGLVAGCNPLDSFDLLYVTELIPTWSDDMLSFFVNPETALFANPAALMACTAEAVTTGVAGMEPMEALFWCAGSWGTLYPMTGSVTHQGSPPADTSLMGARLIAQLHRWGIARKTMGNSCGGDIAFMLPKNQYRMQQYWPLASAIMPGPTPQMEGDAGAGGGQTPGGHGSGGNTGPGTPDGSGQVGAPQGAGGNHWIGESDFRWGVHKNVPGIEDYLHVIFRWNDCCLEL